MKTGQCLCGAATVTAEPFGTFQACHCETCRRWSGGPWMAVPCKSATFQGPIGRYRSSEHADRGFCSQCGTTLFFHARTADIYAVSRDVFDDPSDLPFAAEIYIDEKPDLYAFAGQRKCLTGAEFQAKFR